jgi:putative peptidoglycan lipid II flippase
VAAGILLSRVSGLVRERVFAQFFGVSLYADVFRAALRLPNVLQNLLGEGTLSASFIPVYAELLEQGRHKEAGRFAGAIFSLLLAIAAGLALVGVALAPVGVAVFLPGFTGERRELTITLVRILFPMTGVLVLSAWALGVLNSHRRFFVPYAAPVVWNASIIAAFFLFGARRTGGDLAVAVAVGALVGGALQFLVQLPWVLSVERGLHIAWDLKLEGVREALRNAGPAILGRGVVQVSGYIDMLLASLLAVGAVASIGYAQTLYLLPVSLFGMSIAAAELPELARGRGGSVEILNRRTSAALERVSFYIVPTFAAFLVHGDVLVAAMYQTGEFGVDDTRVVHLTLVGYTVGLLASTTSRLLSSAFFALRDTKTPARYATVRVIVSALLGLVLMAQFEPLPQLGIDAGAFHDVRIGSRALGAVGLTLATGLAAWIEWTLLKRELARRIGPVGVGFGALARMVVSAVAGAASGWGVRSVLPPTHPIVVAALVCGAFGAVYLGLAAGLGLAESQRFVRRLRRS